MSKTLKRLFSFLIVLVFTFSFGLTSSCKKEESDKTESLTESITESVAPTHDYEIKVAKTAYSVKIGNTVKIQVMLRIDGVQSNQDGINFTSADQSIATVDENGLVTAIKCGVTTITVSFKTVSETVTITVEDFEKTIQVDKESYSLSTDETAQITAQGFIEEQLDEDAVITYTSEDETIATVDENGLITAIKHGATNILVTYNTATTKVHVTVYEEISATAVNSFSNEFINTYGRTYISNGKLNLDHTSSAVEVSIIGESLTVNLKASANIYVRVFIDGNSEGERFALLPNKTEYQVAKDLESGYHTIRIVKVSELFDGQIDIESFSAEKFAYAPPKGKLKIEFIGDSITTGYAILGNSNSKRTVENSDSSKSFAYQTAQLLNADYSTIAVQGICALAYHWQTAWNMYDLYQKVSADYNSANYDFNFNPDVVVLLLGGNEASYLSTNPSYASQYPSDYEKMLKLIREKNPNAYIICMYGATSLNTNISSGIIKAINNLNDDKISNFFISSDSSGGAGHPSVSANTRWASQLVEKIQDLIK